MIKWHWKLGFGLSQVPSSKLHAECQYWHESHERRDSELRAWTIGQMQDELWRRDQPRGLP